MVNVVFVNHSYRILNIELARTGAGNPGPTAKSMLELGEPEIDWVKLAEAKASKHRMPSRRKNSTQRWSVPSPQTARS